MLNFNSIMHIVMSNKYNIKWTPVNLVIVFQNYEELHFLILVRNELLWSGLRSGANHEVNTCQAKKVEWQKEEKKGGEERSRLSPGKFLEEETRKFKCDQHTFPLSKSTFS